MEMLRPGQRGLFRLTFKSIQDRTYRQGLYEVERWELFFEDYEGKQYSYLGRKYLLFVGKQYNVTATYDGFRYGYHVLQRLRIRALERGDGDDLFTS